MEIVIVTGVIALAGLVLLTLRMRAARGGVRPSRGARQWSGSAGARRAHAGRPATAAAAAGAVAYRSAGGGGVAVEDPPRTREDELDEWDDDLGWIDDREAPAAAEVLDDEPAARPAAPAPVADPEPEPVPEPAAPLSLAAAPATEPADEPAWDDDLAGEPVRHARPDGGRPLPAARGAAAFGASQATPPAPRRGRAAALRSPVVMVAVYALAGIALVVLAVSLLSGGLSPSPAKETRRAANPAPAPAQPTPSPQEAAAERAAAAAAERRAFERGKRAAEAQQARAERIARERRAARIARERRARRRAAQRRAAQRRAQARAAAPAPGRPSPPSYAPAPAPAPAPAAPAPSTGGSGGSSGGGGGGSSGGGTGGCEFCIG
jgi:2-oxoglutarate dehydrogenase E2 component (dihydrolipoamide succinyltransferase)